MHKIILAAAAAMFLFAISGAGAAPMSTAPGFETGKLSMLELIQANKQKSDTVGQRIKRAWRSLTDYQFCARCSILILPVSSTTCSVSRGKSRNEARATCAARHPLCTISDGAC